MSQVGEDELALLSGLSDLLNMMVPEVEPSSDAIADLLTQTDDLINDITNADDLDPDLRVFLLRHLARVADALRTIRIRGQKGVDDVLGNLVVETYVNRSKWDRAKQFASWPNFQKLIKGISTVARAKNDISEISNLVHDIFEIEGGPTPPSE